MSTPDLGYGSHAPVLASAVRQTNGRVLELGMGYGSSCLLKAMLPPGRQLVSMESNPDWYAAMRNMCAPFDVGRADRYIFSENIRQDLWKAFKAPRWFEVAFVDFAPGEERVPAILKLKDEVTFIVAHDTEADLPGAGGNYGWKQLNGVFKYQYTYKDMRPWTSVYSDERPFEL